MVIRECVFNVNNISNFSEKIPITVENISKNYILGDENIGFGALITSRLDQTPPLSMVK